MEVRKIQLKVKNQYLLPIPVIPGERQPYPLVIPGERQPYPLVIPGRSESGGEGNPGGRENNFIVFSGVYSSTVRISPGFPPSRE